MTDKIQVLGLGAGGHAGVVIEILQENPRFDLVGLLDTQEALWGGSVLGVTVLGDDSLLPRLMQAGSYQFFVGLGGAGSTLPRQRLYEMARAYDLMPVPAIHSSSVISRYARVGLGVTILANAVVNAGAVIGENVILNSGAIVEHDCVIGSHVHIATGARLCGAVTVGAGTHIGAGSTIRQGVSIGSGALVGAGAVVVKDVPPKALVVGVPARVKRIIE